MAKGERDRVTIAAEITKSQKEILTVLSESMDRSISWIIRDAIVNYSNIHKDKIDFDVETGV